jgi:hypothetical protein
MSWKAEGAALQRRDGTLVWQYATDGEAGAALTLLTAAAKKFHPAKDGPFADPVHNKYPIGSAEEVRAALSYLGQKKNADFYPKDGVTLQSVQGKIAQAAKKFGIAVEADVEADAKPWERKSK